jgi:hypothetical protein
MLSNLNNVSQYVDIRVIENSVSWFDSAPHRAKSNYVEAGLGEIVKAIVVQHVRRIPREVFVHGVDAAKQSDSIVLVDKPMSDAIHLHVENALYISQ